MIGDPCNIKISSFSGKRKRLELPSPSAPSRKEKSILQETQQPLLMNNCLIWNTRGAKNAKFKGHCKSLIGMHQSSVLALLETRMAEHKDLAIELGFPYFIQSSATSSLSGIVIFWKNNAISIKEISIPKTFIPLSR